MRCLTATRADNENDLRTWGGLPSTHGARVGCPTITIEATLLRFQAFSTEFPR